MGNPEPALETTRCKIEDEKRATFLLSAERRTLEMIASGAKLHDILEELCDTVVAHKCRPLIGNQSAN